MMKIALVCCDLDGTLIGPSDSGLDEARRVTSLCKENGIYLTIATGRVFGAVERYLVRLAIDTPVISNGGALISSAKGEPLWEKTIPVQSAEFIWKNLVKMRVPSYLVVGKNMLTEWDGPETQAYSRTLGYDIQVVSSCLDRMERGPTQIVVRHDPATIDDLKREFESWCPKEVSVRKTLPHLLEFQPRDVSKAGALERLTQMLRVAKDQVLAVGDGLNDLDMLLWAKERACVANSHPEVIQRVKVVSREPFAWGVMEILRHYLAGNSQPQRE